MEERRTIISCPDPPSRIGRGGGFSRTYRIRVVTPLFGGGTVPGKNDPVTLIRGSSIRGQLRFWWRASRGAACEDVAELRDRETGIFGSAGEASPTQVRVRVVEVGSQAQWQQPAYALFPFRGDSRRSPDGPREPAIATWSAAFDLTVTCLDQAKLENEIEPALWAWVNFGGLGARTRRGCGSLFCEQFSPPQGAKVHDWYASCLKRYGLRLPDEPRSWPTLPQRLLVKEKDVETQDPLRAWQHVVELLQKFRQGPGVGRDPAKRSGDFPGRSRWPEANSLRYLNNRALRRSVTELKLGFPRAEFGLPIVFHFKEVSGRWPEPQDLTLYPADGQRMASPLILKALAVGGGGAAQVIVPLKVEPVKAVRLESKNPQVMAALPKDPFRRDTILRPDLKGSESPLRFSPKGSAVEAFLNFARQEGGFR
ncbi:MAG: type III-B CRISPR module RAMP protein Cmr1 [Bacillota bacterium]|nr:type III-B CRISPR module RAMP protein Cmr1 [Bacillota bacterium]